MKNTRTEIKNINTRMPSFEAAAHYQQYKSRTRPSGPPIGKTPSGNETGADKELLFIVAGVTLFIIMLILV